MCEVGVEPLSPRKASTVTIETEQTQPSPLNVPNLLTSLRFALSVAVLVLVDVGWFWSAMVVFLVAASTDWMDGYWARKYGQVTRLGRIFDPFVDKIIICGTFIALVPIAGSGIAAWMAVVVVGRELLVTSLRGLVEGAGGNFSARQMGKWKMVLQCAAVVLSIGSVALTNPIPGLAILRDVTIWAAIALTLLSGAEYVVVAGRLMRQTESP